MPTVALQKSMDWKLASRIGAPPGNACFKSLTQPSGNVLFEYVVRCGPNKTGSFYLIFWFCLLKPCAIFDTYLGRTAPDTTPIVCSPRKERLGEDQMLMQHTNCLRVNLASTSLVFQVHGHTKQVDDNSPNLVLEVHNICSIMEATESNEITNSILHQPREQPSWKCQSISTV